MNRDDLKYVLMLGTAIVVLPIAGAALLFGALHVWAWILSAG